MLKSNTESVVSIEEVKDFGLIIVKANFLDNKICDLLQTSTGLQTPKTGKISIGKNLSIGWMSKDEYAIILRNVDADRIANKIKVKMKKEDHLCINMSDSRRCFRLLGHGWREVLSKGTPADLHPEVFGVGGFRRTRIANVAVAIWPTSDNEVYIFSMFSVGSFILDWLRTAGLKSGQLNFF